MTTASDARKLFLLAGLPGRRCPTCHAPAFVIDHENRQLRCSHYATRINGVVVGWVDTGAMTLNLARSAMCSDRMAGRAEEHAADVQYWRERAQQLTAPAAR